MKHVIIVKNGKFQENMRKKITTRIPSSNLFLGLDMGSHARYTWVTVNYFIFLNAPPISYNRVFVHSLVCVACISLCHLSFNFVSP